MHPPKSAGCIGVLTADAVKELLKSKRASNRREIYVKSLEFYLNKFAEGRAHIEAITTKEIEDFLGEHKGHYSRQTWLNRISTLFSFSVRRGYCGCNPCDRIDRVTIDRAAPVILTVEQSRKLLDRCPASCLAYLVLGLFAGVRPDEIQRLDWSQVNLQTQTVRVDGKTRRRRLVTLEPAAVKWLKPIAKESGAVAPTPAVVRRWKRSMRGLLGGKWTADVLRHTAASYLLALHQDAARVALLLGNSPQILMTHYNEPVNKADCESFWNL